MRQQHPAKPEERFNTLTGERVKEATGEEKTLTYYELALIQNFGSHTNNIPARDFIGGPIETKKEDILKFMKSDRVKMMIEDKQIKAVYTWLGIMMEGIIVRAFPTSGYGKWKPNAPATIEAKGSDRPLIDIGELSKSITSEVVEVNV